MTHRATRSAARGKRGTHHHRTYHRIYIPQPGRAHSPPDDDWPDDSHDLRLHQATLAVDPAPSKTRWAHDVFNNSICFLEWPKTLRTKHLVTRTAEQALPISGGYLGDPNHPIGLDVCVAVSAVPIMEGVEPVAG